jgi:acyl-CoA synthetase (AMP-forming)/AMP-acid ligase II
MSHVWRSALPYEPAGSMLYQEVLRGAAHGHDRVAVVDAITRRSLTYGELIAGAGAFAGGLRERGARRGDVIAAVVSNRPEFPVIAQGGLIAGLTIALASPVLTARELEAFLRQTRSRFVVAEQGSMDKVRKAADAAGVEAVFVVDALPAGKPMVAEGGDPRATACLWSSSGTTGLPKSVMQPHESLVAMLRQLEAAPFTGVRRWRRSTLTDGCTPATSCASTRTATCSSSTA